MKWRKEYVEINARMIYLHDSSWNLQSYFSLKCNAKKISVNLDDIMWKHISYGICRLDLGVQFVAIRQLSGSNDLDTILVCQHTWPAFQQNKNKPFPKRVLGCFVQINGFFWLHIRPSIPNTPSRMPKTLPLTVIAKLTNFVSSSQFRWYIETSIKRVYHIYHV